MLTSWLHLSALVAYVGAIVGLAFVLLPTLGAVESHEARLKLLARSLKFYNPLQCGALGILVLTGAIQVTDLKAGGSFAKEIAMLGLKLLLAFILILLSTYQSMGVALRFVRRCESGDPIAPEELQALARRLKNSTIPLLFLAAVTIWTGMQLRR